MEKLIDQAVESNGADFSELLSRDCFVRFRPAGFNRLPPTEPAVSTAAGVALERRHASLRCCASSHPASQSSPAGVRPGPSPTSAPRAAVSPSRAACSQTASGSPQQLADLQTSLSQDAGTYFAPRPRSAACVPVDDPSPAEDSRGRLPPGRSRWVRWPDGFPNSRLQPVASRIPPDRLKPPLQAAASSLSDFL